MRSLVCPHFGPPAAVQPRRFSGGGTLATDGWDGNAVYDSIAANRYEPAFRSLDRGEGRLTTGSAGGVISKIPAKQLPVKTVRRCDLRYSAAVNDAWICRSAMLRNRWSGRRPAS